MRITKCHHAYCDKDGVDVLRDNKNIYCWFCAEHFEIYKALPAYTYNWEESQLHKRFKYGF